MSLLEVKIPPMGESISSGVLAKWHVKVGDVVIGMTTPLLVTAISPAR